MPTIAASYEIRWRLAGSAGAWKTKTVPATSESIKIDGLERGKEYEGEARALSAAGTPSDWVAVDFTVDNPTLSPRAPTNLTALAVADGVSLKWLVDDAQPAGVEYCIERADGVDGTYAEFTRVNALQYTYPMTDGVTRWFRVRAVNFGLVYSAYSNKISSAAVPLGPVIGEVAGLRDDVDDHTAELILQQAAIDAEAAARLAADLAEVSARGAAVTAAAAAAAADATAKADAARAAAIAHADVIGAQVADIIGAPDWVTGTAYVTGDLVKYGTGLYRALRNNTSKQPSTNPLDWESLGEYSSLGEAVAGSIAVGTANTSAIAAEAAQLDAVQARMSGTSGALATSAMVTDEATARATADTALGTRTTTLETNVNHATTGLAATRARLITEETARADADTALGQRVDVVTATIGAVMMLENPSFEVDSGWGSNASGDNGTLAAGMAYTTDASVSYHGNRHLRITAVPGDAGRAIYNRATFKMDVNSKVRIRIRSRTAGALASGDSIRIGLRLFGADGSHQGNAYIPWKSGPGTWLYPDGTMEGVITTANAAVAYARVIIYALVTAGVIVIDAIDASVDDISDDVLTASVTTVETASVTRDTALGSRIDSTNAEVAGKASSGAVAALDSRVTTAEGVISSQGSAITATNAALSTTNGNVTAAQTAANNAATLAGSKGKVIYGSTAPAAGDRTPENLWIDTTGGNNTPKRWTSGTTWVAVTDKIATDAAAAAAAAAATAATKADASAVSSLDTRVTAAEGVISTQGTAITAANAAIAGKANTGAVTALDTRVTAAEGAITSQGTALTSVNASLATMDAGVRYTAGASGLATYWHTAVGSPEISYIADATAMGGYVVRLGNNSGNDGFQMAMLQRLPLDPTKLYRLRTRIRRVSGTGTLYLGVAARNADNTVYVTGNNTVGSAIGGHYTTSNVSPALGTWMVYEGYVKGRTAGASTGTGTQASPRAIAAQGAYITPLIFGNYNGLAGEVEIDYIILEEIEALELARSNVTATTLLSAEVSSVGNVAKAAHTVTLDVGGNISGTRSENDGATSKFSVLATIFRVLGFGSSGMEWQDGYLRIWKGSSQVILGNSFGASGDIVFWYGPNIGAAACTKANGTIWFDTASGAYFGGTLSAGTLKNAVQTTTTVTTGTELIDGPFTTNGNTRTVTISFNRTHHRSRSAYGSQGFVAGAGTNTATVQVYRKIGAAAESLWQTINVTGAVNIGNETDSPDQATSTWGGSMTVNDTSSSASTVQYRVLISAFSEQTVTHQSGSFDSQTITQNLSIISVEQ